MFRSLLVPLDGSTFGEQALPFALSLARRAGAAGQLVHVHVPLAPRYAESMLAFDTALDQTAREQENAYLETTVQRLAGISSVPVTAKLLEVPVADAIQERALATGTDMVLGSVADRMLRGAATPVLIHRPITH